MSDYWQYNFPPFFTIQPNDETRQIQLDAWCQIIVDHCKKNRIFQLNVSDSISRPPFRNDSINRSLNRAALIQILNEMERRGRIEWIRQQGDTEDNLCLVYWLKPDEWADVIRKLVDSKSLNGTVCTFYEITADDSSIPELVGLDERILLKAIKYMEKSGKAALIKMDNSYGVKFL